MNIPDKIKLGDHYYNIKKVKIISRMNKNIVGNIDYYNKIIKIKKLKIFKHDKKMYEGVFFHEVAHGVLKEMEYNYPQIAKLRNNEEFTQELGLTLRKFFLDLLNSQEDKNDTC